MSNTTRSLTELATKTVVVGSIGFIISRVSIGLYNYLTARELFKDKSNATTQIPYNQNYPIFEFLVGRPDDETADKVHRTIRAYLDQQPIPATCTITDATCMYNGKFPATEPCHRVLLTFNPMRVDPDTAQQVAQDLATHLAHELKQFIVPGYEYRTARVFKGIGNVPTS